MKKRKLAALLILVGFVFVLAQGPMKARPARPARPVQEENNFALPLNGRIIFVDAGHGGTDGGARAKKSGKWEKEMNLQVAMKLKACLEAQGAIVIMSREADQAYDQNKRRDLTARLDLAKARGAQILLSIHMNEYRSASESGPQVFYRKGQEQGRLLAGVLQEYLIRELHPPKKRTSMAGDYFILSSSIPSVLVECGFLSNAQEEKLLLTEEYQLQVAQALCHGVIAYFSLPISGE